MKLLKKNLCGMLSATMLITSAAIPVIAEDDMTVKLDGQTLSFDVPPQIINDRTIIVDEASGTMTVDLEAYGKQLQKQSIGANYIKALNLQNEALLLQMHKTNIFQSFDVKNIFN